jgi:hypothetical protein
MLNWEKYHFIVQQGIVLGHVVLKKGLEVDTTKVERISRLCKYKSVKEIKAFLGHAGFYDKFTKDFSKIA